MSTPPVFRPAAIRRYAAISDADTGLARVDVERLIVFWALIALCVVGAVVALVMLLPLVTT
jgi:hypothetical protein